MILNDKHLIDLLNQDQAKEEIDTAYLDYFNIIKIKTTNIFDNIEFLSLRNNNIKPYSKQINNYINKF